MSSWIELEKRFLEVEPALRFARLDVGSASSRYPAWVAESYEKP
jgi:hypothetical protein